MYEKAEVTLVDDEVEAVKDLLKDQIAFLKRTGFGYKAAEPYISVLDKIVDATREVQ